jgi:hypothetical protein
MAIFLRRARGLDLEPVRARLRALIESGVAEEHEIEHALAFHLWPIVLAGRSAERPESVRELLGRTCLVAGVEPSTAPEEARARVEKLFERFPPAPAVTAELADLTRQIEDSLRDRSAGASRAFLGELPPVEATEDGPKIRNLPGARFDLKRS